jgi:hypothetical protein
MSLKSKQRKKDRLAPKVRAWYYKYNKWLAREPATRNPILHMRWEKEEPVKPKWLKEYEGGH